MSVLGLILSSFPYLRSVMVRFPLSFSSELQKEQIWNWLFAQKYPPIFFQIQPKFNKIPMCWPKILLNLSYIPLDLTPITIDIDIDMLIGHG